MSPAHAPLPPTSWRHVPHVPLLRQGDAAQQDLRTHLTTVLAVLHEAVLHRHAADALTRAQINQYKALRKRVGRLQDQRRTSRTHTLSQLLHGAQVLVGELTGDPLARVPFAPTSPVPTRAPKPAAPHLTTPAVITIASILEDAERLRAFRAARIADADWAWACATPTLRTPAVFTAASLLGADRGELPDHVWQQHAYFSARTVDGLAPRAAMRKVTGRTQLTSRDYKRAAAYEARIIAHDGFAAGMIGQRRAYGTSNLVRALMYATLVDRTGAKATAVYEHVLAELRSLLSEANAVGIPVTLSVPSETRPGRHAASDHPRGADQLVLAADYPPATSLQLHVPSVRTMQRQIKALPVIVHDLRANGMAYIQRAFRPVDAFTRAERPHACWQIDHTMLKNAVLLPATAAGAPPRVVRVYVTYIVDQFTNRVIAYNVSLTAPTSITNAFTLYRALHPMPQIGRRQCVLPEALRVDMGADFVSKRLRGILAQLGIIHEPCRPHRPDDKATVERAFRTLKDTLSATQGFTEAPGEKGSAIRCDRALPYDDLFAVLDGAVRHHNARHADPEVPAVTDAHAAARPVPNDRALMRALLWTEHVRTLTPNGVRFANTVLRGTLRDRHGRSNLELRDTRIRLYFMPGVTDRVYAFAADESPEGFGAPEEYLGELFPDTGTARVDLDVSYHEPMRQLRTVQENLKRLADPATRPVGGVATDRTAPLRLGTGQTEASAAVRAEAREELTPVIPALDDGPDYVIIEHDAADDWLHEAERARAFGLAAPDGQPRDAQDDA